MKRILPIPLIAILAGVVWLLYSAKRKKESAPLGITIKCIGFDLRQ